jgi:hypothetical protein
MRQAFAALLVVLCACAPARADWLVLVSGVRIETKGAWLVKGRQVRFTTARTNLLQSVALSEVDLEASRRATGPDPNLSHVAAVAQGDAVLIGIDPEHRPKLDAVPLPKKIRELAAAELNPRSIRGDRSLFGQGTLSTGTSISSQLYEQSPHLAALRQKAVAVVGETVVAEVEAELSGAEGEIYDLCVAAGADPVSDGPRYCYAFVLSAALNELIARGAELITAAPSAPVESGAAGEDAQEKPPAL